MIQILFSLRFQTQIRRTRPALYKSIENSITEAIKASGGMLGTEQRYISASFDEKIIGFWIGILTVVETIGNTMKDAASELYGYIAVLGCNVEAEEMQQFRRISSGEGGIWCDPLVQKALAVYGAFESPLDGERINPAVAGYARLKDIHAFSGGGRAGENRAEIFFPYRERIPYVLRQEEARNILLTGPRFIGKREGLRRYCVSLTGETPPLAVTFGAGGGGISCLADALTQPVRSFIAPYAGEEVMGTLDALRASIDRDRFRTQHSGSLLSKADQFFHILCETYTVAVKQAGRPPIIILENIHEADAGAVQAFVNWYKTDSGASGFLIYGTCSDAYYPEPAECASSDSTRFVPGLWTRIFSRVLHFPSTDVPPPLNLSFDLCEIAYMFALFRRYFPPSQFPVLFKEAGINPRMVARTLNFFFQEGLIDFREDPLFRIAGFIPWAEGMLGKRKEYIQSIVLNRILAWVEGKKFNPCFNVLKAISDLGGRGSDILVLDSLMGDIVNGTYQEIDEGINSEIFENLAGANCASVLRYIAVTNKALLHGTEEDIRTAFLSAPPESDAFPFYKTHIYISITRYYLSIRDSSSALKFAKQAMILSQTWKKEKGIAQVYRLFSLVNVSQQHLSDALEYLTFAIEHAEFIDAQDELALAAYYAAGTNFLFGNISKAERLALLSETAAAASNRTEWADRSRFLLGRIYFETGRYQEAQDIFEDLESRYLPSSNQAQVCSAWIFRTDVFLNRLHPRVPGTMNYDAQLFAVEAAYLSGNYRETITRSEALSMILTEGNFLFIEQPDWRSGFSQCEFLLFSMQNFFSRMLSAYCALALCRVNQSGGFRKEPGESNARQDAEKKSKSSVLSFTQIEAQDCIRRVLREEGMPHLDPNDAFYYYVQYCVLQETSGMEIDMNTAVSLAFKRLQSRASRIDDLEIKDSYLSRNYWNKALSQAAKQHKLI